MKKINIIACLLVLMSTSKLSAQQEIFVSAGGGLSTLKATSDMVKANNKMAPNFALGFRTHVSKKFSLATGVEFAFYNSELEFNKFNEKYKTKDSEGESFEFNSELENYKEDIKSTFLNIPITVQYTTSITPISKIYIQIGGKIGFPLSSKNKGYIEKLHTYGVYKLSTGDVPFENIPSEGFGTFNNVPTDDKADFKMAFMFTSEVGLKWALSSRNSLYAGVYFDYGLNNLIKGEADKKMVNYNASSPSDLAYSSVTSIENGVKKLIPMAIGVKMAFTFSLSKPKKGGRELDL